MTLGYWWVLRGMWLEFAKAEVHAMHQESSLEWKLNSSWSVDVGRFQAAFSPRLLSLQCSQRSG